MHQGWKDGTRLLVTYNYSKQYMSNILDIIERGCQGKRKKTPYAFGVALLSECLQLRAC